MPAEKGLTCLSGLWARHKLVLDGQSCESHIATTNAIASPQSWETLSAQRVRSARADQRGTAVGVHEGRKRGEGVTIYFMCEDALAF